MKRIKNKFFILIPSVILIPRSGEESKSFIICVHILFFQDYLLLQYKELY
jgi:hypothetical protein